MDIQDSRTYSSKEKPWLRYYPEDALQCEVPKVKIYTYLYECNKNHMDDVALLYYGRKITFRSLFEEVDVVAKGLVAIGVKRGDIVTLTVPTLPETVYLFFALNKLGAVANSIDPRTNEERLRTYMKNTNSKIVFTIDKYSQVLSRAINGTDIKQGVIVSAKNSLPCNKKMLYSLVEIAKGFKDKDAATTKDKRFIMWNQFVKKGSGIDCVEEAPFEENTPAGIVYTSGTTGIPKGALLSNENLVVQAINMKHAVFIKNHGMGLHFLNIMPPWLAYGLTCGLSSILCMGLQMDMIPKFDYKKFDKILLEHRPEVILGVPTFFEELIKSKRLAGKDLSFLKIIIVGGSPLNVGTEEKINQFFQEHNANIKITKGYGMTEMCAVATYSGKEEYNHYGSVGIPLVMNNVAVVNPDTGEYCTYNEVGEFYLTGPTRMLGYYNNPSETAKIFVEKDGITWVKTGDMGYISENGELFHKSRIKQIMIFEGHNVFGSVIEDVLSQHPMVAQVAVAGVIYPDSQNCEIPTAFIVLKETTKPKKEIIAELKELSRQKLPQRDVAQDYKIVESIPLTPVGKVDYEKLRKAEVSAK